MAKNNRRIRTIKNDLPADFIPLHKRLVTRNEAWIRREQRKFDRLRHKIKQLQAENENLRKQLSSQEKI